MPRADGYDAVVVGSGPNGLAAAIELARNGRAVVLYEGADSLGGGVRSAELTLPGFSHDHCAAVFPMAAASAFFRSLPLAQHGLEWIHPPAPVAHPLDGGRAVVLERSVEATARGLGRDEAAYRRLFGPLVEAWQHLEGSLLSPLLQVPRHPVTFARFAFHAVRSARGLAEGVFEDAPARALFAGNAAHSALSLDRVPSASFGLVLSLAGHAVGWPLARGGSGRLTEALASIFRSLGGEIVTGTFVRSLRELPPARLVLCDVAPVQLVALAGDRLPPSYRRRLERYYYGPGVFKLDWALAAPIPWTAPECGRAGTLHLGGTLDEIAASEEAVWQGRHSERPLVLFAQPSRFDPSRAPEGKHTAWGFCHVPNGSTFDMAERIERQVERFAPGFRELVLARSVTTPADFERENPNFVGGDTVGGASDLRQLLARPVLRPVPYATPVPGLYLCSASTPPGGGVHGMCGYLAARAALSWDS